MRLIVREYLTADGRSPWRTWLDELDVSTRARVQARVLRFESGNLGDHKALGDGLWEARLFFGPGYRVYFSRHERALILLLAGGDKGSQYRDIGQARRRLADYLEAVRHGKA
jgi:putative addiction module killer protein